MAIKDRIKATMLNLRRSGKRFPITIFLSLGITGLLIYLNEVELKVNVMENLTKLALLLGLAIILSASIKLMIERFFKDRKGLAYLLNLAGVGLLTLYYFIYMKDMGSIFLSRYMGSLIFLILVFLYIPRLGKKNSLDSYEYYIMDIASNFALTFIYSLVLYLGLSAIIFTISHLFDVNIRGTIYYYMFLCVFFIFAISLFLSKLPPIGETYERKDMTRSLKALLLYIVIPLISIYSLILYVYFAKILITRDWPKGLVSHLVLWYSTISVGVLFLISPILDENKYANLFKLYFPKIILPILFMMFASIYQRVNQYGITENRYYLIALGLWVLATMIYFSIKKSLRNIIIPISLSLVVFVSIFGPLSSFNLSKYSQNRRLEKILSSRQILVNGEIRSREDIDLEDRREISNIISYFDLNHDLADIRRLPEGFQLEDMEKLMGFKYEPGVIHPDVRDEYFYIGFNINEKIIDISGFDYFLIMNHWDNSSRQAGDLRLNYNNASKSINVYRNGQSILVEDIGSYIEEIYLRERDKPNIERDRDLNIEDMSYDLTLDELEDINIKIIFSNISGRIDGRDNLSDPSVEFILLINY